MKRLLIVASSILAILVPATAASAAPHNPTGAYADFGWCPLGNPALDVCFHSRSTSGSVTTGNKTVPIVNPVVLQGGVDWVEDLFGPLTFLAAEENNTLVKSPQPVPGGLLGITAPAWWPKFLRDLFNETINNGFTGVTSTVELAGPASAIKLNVLAQIAGFGTALQMPVKIKLENPFLGSNCYVGSNSNPIVWKFTTGTTAPPPPNTPIKGNPGTFGGSEEGNILTTAGVKLVDNSFAVPGASGCGGLFSFLIDPFVNSIVGLPSAAGKNTAILEPTVKMANPAAVIASE